MPKPPLNPEATLFDLEARTPALLPSPTIDDEPALCPSLLEYTPLASTEPWRVEKFDLLAAEFNLCAPWPMMMVMFHEVAANGATRGWLIARRLFGVMPMIPGKDAQPEDLRCWGRSELAEALGTDSMQLQAELDAVRVMWESHRRREEPEEEAKFQSPTPKVEELAPPGEMRFGHEALEKYGFPEAIFDVSWYDAIQKTTQTRPADIRRRERDRFAQWVTVWSKMLDEPMAEPVAREALLNRLYLERIAVDMSRVPPTHPNFDKLSITKKSMEEALREQLEKLEGMFPEMGGVAGRVSFRAVISELNKGYRDYYGNSDNRLVNKIHTAAEMEVELRQSQQDPQARLRFGLNVAIIEAVQGLFDPNWRPKFKHAVLRKLDAAAKKAVDEARLASGEALVDLEADGPGGEYPELEESGESASK